MNNIRAVFFDVDGVLLNSLPEHLQICKDIAHQYSPDCDIPDEETFKMMVHEGKKISPMKYFFMTVGYNEEAAKKAEKEYQETFMSKYNPKPFDAIPNMLKSIKEAGLSLGIVTSNVEKNIKKALGNCMKYFDRNCCFTKDGMNSMDKSDALLEGCRLLDIKPDQAIFVGDQFADYKAAEKAKMPFLGVSYGWCFSNEETDIAIADSPKDVAIYILSKVALYYNSQKDRNIIWQRYKEAAGAEKEWMNERLSWLFTPQGVLFAAFSITLRSNTVEDSHLINVIRNILPLLGIAISIVVFMAVLSAAVMHRKWFKKLQEIARKNPYDEFTFGSAPDWPAWLARWFPISIPILFVFAWFFLLILR